MPSRWGYRRFPGRPSASLRVEQDINQNFVNVVAHCSVEEEIMSGLLSILGRSPEEQAQLLEEALQGVQAQELDQISQELDANIQPVEGQVVQQGQDLDQQDQQVGGQGVEADQEGGEVQLDPDGCPKQEGEQDRGQDKNEEQRDAEEKDKEIEFVQNENLDPTKSRGKENESLDQEGRMKDLGAFGNIDDFENREDFQNMQHPWQERRQDSLGEDNEQPIQQDNREATNQEHNKREANQENVELTVQDPSAEEKEVNEEGENVQDTQATRGVLSEEERNNENESLDQGLEKDTACDEDSDDDPDEDSDENSDEDSDEDSDEEQVHQQQVEQEQVHQEQMHLDPVHLGHLHLDNMQEDHDEQYLQSPLPGMVVEVQLEESFELAFIHGAQELQNDSHVLVVEYCGQSPNHEQGEMNNPEENDGGHNQENLREDRRYSLDEELAQINLHVILAGEQERGQISSGEGNEALIAQEELTSAGRHELQEQSSLDLAHQVVPGVHFEEEQLDPGTCSPQQHEQASLMTWAERFPSRPPFGPSEEAIAPQLSVVVVPQNVLHNELHLPPIGTSPDIASAPTGPSAAAQVVADWVNLLTRFTEETTPDPYSGMVAEEPVAGPSGITNGLSSAQRDHQSYSVSQSQLIARVLQSQQQGDSAGHGGPYALPDIRTPISSESSPGSLVVRVSSPIETSSVDLSQAASQHENIQEPCLSPVTSTSTLSDESDPLILTSHVQKRKEDKDEDKAQTDGEDSITEGASDTFSVTLQGVSDDGQSSPKQPILEQGELGFSRGRDLPSTPIQSHEQVHSQHMAPISHDLPPSSTETRTDMGHVYRTSHSTADPAPVTVTDSNNNEETTVSTNTVSYQLAPSSNPVRPYSLLAPEQFVRTEYFPVSYPPSSLNLINTATISSAATGRQYRVSSIPSSFYIEVVPPRNQAQDLLAVQRIVEYPLDTGITLQPPPASDPGNQLISIQTPCASLVPSAMQKQTSDLDYSQRSNAVPSNIPLELPQTTNIPDPLGTNSVKDNTSGSVSHLPAQPDNELPPSHGVTDQDSKNISTDDESPSPTAGPTQLARSASALLSTTDDGSPSPTAGPTQLARSASSLLSTTDDGSPSPTAAPRQLARSASSPLASPGASARKRRHLDRRCPSRQEIDEVIARHNEQGVLLERLLQSHRESSLFWQWAESHLAACSCQQAAELQSQDQGDDRVRDSPPSPPRKSDSPHSSSNTGVRPAHWTRSSIRNLHSPAMSASAPQQGPNTGPPAAGSASDSREPTSADSAPSNLFLNPDWTSGQAATSQPTPTHSQVDVNRPPLLGEAPIPWPHHNPRGITPLSPTIWDAAESAKADAASSTQQESPRPERPRRGVPESQPDLIPHSSTPGRNRDPHRSSGTYGTPSYELPRGDRDERVLVGRWDTYRSPYAPQPLLPDTSYPGGDYDAARRSWEASCRPVTYPHLNQPFDPRTSHYYASRDLSRVSDRPPSRAPTLTGHYSDVVRGPQMPTPAGSGRSPRSLGNYFPVPRYFRNQAESCWVSSGPYPSGPYPQNAAGRVGSAEGRDSAMRNRRGWPRRSQNSRERCFCSNKNCRHFSRPN